MESNKRNNEAHEEEAHEALKKRISGHPLYGLLVENHIDCLKISCIGDEEHSDEDNINHILPGKKPSSSSLTQSELDHFMEAYCSALRKLKEAMVEPQQETVAFINTMHLQLTDLTATYHHPSTPLSGERND